MRTVPFLVVLVVAAAACSRDPGPKPASTTASAAGQAASNGGALTEGGPAPKFHVKAHDGADLSLEALRGKHVIVYFYPKDETPGCTKQACALRDAWTEISKRPVVLIGVSADSDDSHRKFAANHKLPFHLVSDPQGELAALFGVPTTLGMTARQSFVIDAEGRVKKIFREVNVSTHAQDVMASVPAS